MSAKHKTHRDPPPSSAFDAKMMRRAISLSRRGEGLVEPNPMVGCVIVKKGRIIGEGYHRRFGGAHAEIEALRSCEENPRGSVVYVTLEPCCHHGKTPPCVEALLTARIARVIVAVRDPHPVVAGGGLRQLRRGDVKVEVDLLAQPAGEVLAPYLTRIIQHRPYVTAKWAQSLDGKLATRSGHSQWISCEASRLRVHRLRARVDAILVGSQTVLADDPMLTARQVRHRRQALRVILDGRLRLPMKSQIVQTSGDHPTLLVTTPAQAKSTKARRLVNRGVEVITCRQARGRSALADLLAKLAKRDVTNLLVEGGPTLLTSFLDAGLVDEAWVFTAPMILGGKNAPSVMDGRGAARVDDAVKPLRTEVRMSGIDVFHRLRLTTTPVS